MDTRTRLANYFRAGYPCVALQTTEEARACADVVAAARATGKRVLTWSAVRGIEELPGPDAKTAPRATPDTEDLLPALRAPLGSEAVLILRDPHTFPFDRDPVLTRALRETVAAAPAAGNTIVILAPNFTPHATVAKLVTVLDYTLPGPDDLARIAAGIAESAGAEVGAVAGADVIRALGGLTTTEAENALALSLIETGAFTPAVIYREKTAAVRRSGLLEIMDPDPRGMAGVGGFDLAKTWLARRREVFSDRARAFGLPEPKGVLIVGPPGTGKSLLAKAVGTILGCPTVRLDIGAMFNSLVGESEARMRDALELAGAIAPCCLFVDEADKGLAGASGSGSGDSGVTKRLFGTLLSWMQERKRPVFLVATANDVTSLPPELLRKGRFDEIFAVDLPTAEERAEILAIHLGKRGRAPEAFDLARVAAATDTFTGSEIEAVLTEALFAAFDAGREVTTDDLLAAVATIVPLAVTAKEQIAAGRAWAATRARAASSRTTPGAAPIPTEGGQRRLQVMGVIVGREATPTPEVTGEDGKN